MTTKAILFAIFLHVVCTLAKTTTVEVAPDGQLTYGPSTIMAAQGDTVKFEFYPQNHTVTQANYADPCVPAPGGINSGFIPTMNGEASQYFTVTINNTDPIWLYCAQARHCQFGMVAVINPPDGSDMTLEKFKSAASSAPSNIPATEGIMGGTISSHSESTASTTGSSSSPTGTSSTKTGASMSAATSTASAAATRAASILTTDNTRDTVVGVIAASFSWWLL